MCNISGVVFCARNLPPDRVRGSRILEVGSYHPLGALRRILEVASPSEYVGIDIRPGPGVDLVCDAERLTERFGEESFDIVIATELIEHVRDWRAVVSKLKATCRRGGYVVITTRSVGFPYHPFPEDYWRFEEGDFRRIFSDLEVLCLERDAEAPGVFLMARKPQAFVENPAFDLALFSMQAGRRVNNLLPAHLASRHFRRLRAAFAARQWVSRRLADVGAAF